MTKGYINITETAKLLDYVEYPTFRVESWICEEGIWECIWYTGNDGLVPNTYKLTII